MGRPYSFLIPKYIFFPKRETVIFKASGGGWRRLSFCKQDIYLDNRAGIALILI